MRLSEQRRAQAPEADSLRMGCGWSRGDTNKPWILIESTAGDSHPGSIHLPGLTKAVEKGIVAAGGAPAHYTCTDICDGIAQGTDGMDYSLPSREVMVQACEMHAGAGHFDAAVWVAGCDKSLPAHLIAACRTNLPAVVQPGGVMMAGPDGQTLEAVGTLHSKLKRGEVSEADYEFLRESACSSGGSCSFFGTATTMQLLSEVLGLALPGSALIPSHLNALKRSAQRCGERAVSVLQEDLRPSQIVTQAALENALMVHAACGGSTNALLHLAALAYELDLHFDYALVEAMNRRVPFILNLKPSGRFSADKVWFAGGVPRILKELQSVLHMDQLTVSGFTHAENIKHLEQLGHFQQITGWLTEYQANVTDIIKPFNKPLRPEGAIKVLTGTIAPEGSVFKVSAAHLGKSVETYTAKVFDSQAAALKALFDGTIQPGDALIIRYEGPAATGMPEQFYVTEALASNLSLSTTTCLITDGRFSGASRGPAIGHVVPEAQRGGPIALLQTGDRIELNLSTNQINLVGTTDKLSITATEAGALLAERKSTWQPPELKHSKGLLGLYTRQCRSVIEGAGL